MWRGLFCYPPPPPLIYFFALQEPPKLNKNERMDLALRAIEKDVLAGRIDKDIESLEVNDFSRGGDSECIYAPDSSDEALGLYHNANGEIGGATSSSVADSSESRLYIEEDDEDECIMAQCQFDEPLAEAIFGEKPKTVMLVEDHHDLDSPDPWPSPGSSADEGSAAECAFVRLRMEASVERPSFSQGATQEARSVREDADRGGAAIAAGGGCSTDEEEGAISTAKRARTSA